MGPKLEVLQDTRRMSITIGTRLTKNSHNTYMHLNSHSSNLSCRCCVYIDNDLEFSSYVQYITSRAFKTFGFIMRKVQTIP